MRNNAFYQLLVFVLVLASLAPGVLAQQGRYAAVSGDGRRVTGDKLTGWQAPGRTIRLDNKVISERGKPLRWLRDRTLKPWRPDQQRGGYVEFFGGDRITGNLIGGKSAAWSDGVYVPDHLVLHPISTKRLYTHGSDVEILRVLPQSIRRVVLQGGSARSFQAGMIFYRDRRRVGFTSIRWRETSVQLLHDSGSSTVPLSEIAEIHMPKCDPWDAYYRELAVLSPDCRSGLIRIETTEGIVATASIERFGAVPFYSGDQLRQADERRKHYRRRIESLVTQQRQRQEKLQKALAGYDKQIAALALSIKKETEANKKAMLAATARMETEKKAAASRYAAERKKLEDRHRKKVADIEKRVAGMEAKKRDSQRKRDIASSKRDRDRALTSLASREKSDQKKMLDGLERLKKSYDKKLQSIIRSRQRVELSKVNAVKSAAAERERSRYPAELESHKALMAALPGADGNQDSWMHMVQPAWSLDPIWVPFKTISMRCSFAPETVPLSRMRPDGSVSPAMLNWRADRNASGGRLGSGGASAGWGFGVHAYSELNFVLPSEAIWFRSRIGLDSVVGDGGCVRARVYLGSIKNKPVYESPLLIGSRKSEDTGVVRLPQPGKAPRVLVLQVDPVNRGHPPQADPLNIRDTFDWLEPQIAFDPVKLRSAVNRHVERNTPVWRDWSVSYDKRGKYVRRNWLDKSARGERGVFLTAVSAQGQAMKLSREMKISADDKWLIVDVGSTDGRNIDAGAVNLRIDGKDIPAEKMPVRQYWRPRSSPLVYPIRKYAGKKVKLELAQRADGRDVYWRGISTAGSLPGTHVLKNVLVASGKGDMKVTRGLGLTLQSGGIKKEYVLEALKIMRLGGRVTFCNEVTGQLRYEYLYGVMIGYDWTGGDKAFLAMKDLRWVRMILLSKDAGVSDGAVEQLKRAKGEEFVVRVVHRTPSGWGGMSCWLTVRNRSRNEVRISRVHGWGGLTDHRLIKAGGELRLHTHEGYRYEAYNIRANHNKDKPLSRTTANGDTTWEIK